MSAGNRFDPPHGRHRLAVFVAREHPSAEHARASAGLAELAAAAGAEASFFHTRIPDPRALPAELRAQVGTGTYVPNNPLLQAEDLEHTWRVERARLDGLVDALADVAHQSRAGVLVNRDVREALSATRTARAWHARAVVIRGLDAPAVHGIVASHLLELPLVAVLDELGGEFAILLPMLLERSSLVVAESPAAFSGLTRDFGDDVRQKLVDGSRPADVADRLRRVLAEERGPDAPKLGADAAFVTFPAGTAAAPAKGPAQPFVVIGSERTGSTALVDLLRAQPGLVCADEIYNPQQIHDRTIAWLGRSAADRPQLVALRRTDPAALHRRLVQDAADLGADHAGFKLLYAHGAADDRITSFLAADPELRVVHVTRRNRLRRWVSHLRAEATGEWYSRDKAAPRGAPEPVELDVDGVLDNFLTVELLEDRYRSLFRNHRMLELVYEEFTADLPAAMRAAGAFFGLDFAAVEPKSRKTGSGPLARVIRNHDEVRDALSGTRWQEFVEEERT